MYQNGLPISIVYLPLAKWIASSLHVGKKPFFLTKKTDSTPTILGRRASKYKAKVKVGNSHLETYYIKNSERPELQTKWSSSLPLLANWNSSIASLSFIWKFHCLKYFYYTIPKGAKSRNPKTTPFLFFRIKKLLPLSFFLSSPRLLWFIMQV